MVQKVIGYFGLRSECVFGDVLGLTCLVGLTRNMGDIIIMCLGLHALCGEYVYMVYTDYTDYTDR